MSNRSGQIHILAWYRQLIEPKLGLALYYTPFLPTVINAIQ